MNHCVDTSGILDIVMDSKLLRLRRTQAYGKLRMTYADHKYLDTL